MKITAVDHITINCRDPQASFRFYEEILELKKDSEVDLGDHVLHYYTLPGVRLELIAYKEGQKLWETGNTDVGIYRHMALTVEGFDELVGRCRAAGVGINLEPAYIDGIGKTVMLIKDPNGVEIEIIKAN